MLSRFSCFAVSDDKLIDKSAEPCWGLALLAGLLETLPLSGWAAETDIAFVLLDPSICRSSDLEKGRNPEVRKGKWNILRHIAKGISFHAVTPRESSGSTPIFKTESPVQELFNQKHGLSFDSLQQLQQCAMHHFCENMKTCNESLGYFDNSWQLLPGKWHVRISPRKHMHWGQHCRSYRWTVWPTWKNWQKCVSLHFLLRLILESVKISFSWGGSWYFHLSLDETPHVSRPKQFPETWSKWWGIIFSYLPMIQSGRDQKCQFSWNLLRSWPTPWP